VDRGLDSEGHFTLISVLRPRSGQEGEEHEVERTLREKVSIPAGTRTKKTVGGNVLSVETLGRNVEV